MPKIGDETYITPLETALLFEIGKNNPLIKQEETIAIFETLIKKLKGEVKNEDITG